ncbi:unnamed protein product [Brassica rapa]|uniref:Uncharacterized protein n=1 Tax=Brassica campestris TaxID=3711 RepID=A0A8D9GUK7_BRACM|nr:unnamed protein product [Brassica rapa]
MQLRRGKSKGVRDERDRLQSRGRRRRRRRRPGFLS